jgi:hypothetical protein
MAAARPDARAHAPLDRAHQRAVVEERDVLLPGQPHQRAQGPVSGEVEHPPRGDGVGAHGVHTACSHGRKVSLHGIGRWKLVPLLVGPEGAVGNATQQQLLLPGVQELAAHRRSQQLCPVVRLRESDDHRRTVASVRPFHDR